MDAMRRIGTNIGIISGIVFISIDTGIGELKDGTARLDETTGVLETRMSGFQEHVAGNRNRFCHPGRGFDLTSHRRLTTTRPRSAWGGSHFMKKIAKAG